ncbi:MAG TPA: PqqD family protein [Acidimicrobiales bacterium]|nr:PqqD family protein [Acidimicrobiales bacterium]
MKRYPATPGTPSFEIPMWVLRRQVDRQMVLLNLQSEQYFGLNDVGADIVTRVTEQPLEEALVALVDDYEIDPEILLRDVDNLIDDLIGEGLLGRTETST